MIKRFEEYLNENIESLDDFVEKMDESIREIFYCIKNKEKVTLTKIPATQYKKALEEFIKYGEFLRFPTKKIEQWKEIILHNTGLLNATTSIFGHTTYFPSDDFLDVFDYDPDKGDGYGDYSKWLNKMYKKTKDEDYKDTRDYNNMTKYLYEVCDIDSYIPTFSNGQPLLSDYGLEPLLKECETLCELTEPEEIIVSINRALDISHQRSDLSEIFIEGGYATLNSISGIEKMYEIKRFKDFNYDL